MFRRLFAACVMLVLPAVAFAHEGVGPHGGPLSDAGPYYIELVAKGTQLSFFVFDDKTSSPVETKGATATATVLAGQKEQAVTLQPGAPGGKDNNAMVGQLGTSAEKGMRIVVLVHLPGKPTAVARFAL